MTMWWRRVAQLPWREAIADADPLHHFSVIVKGLCAFHVFRSYVADITFLMGPSMMPTFNLTGDVVLMNKFYSRWGQLNTGDVVMLLSPENPRTQLAKRILGVEGDTVTYLVNPENSDASKTVVVPKGHIFVQGDNIYSSHDSRNFGSVPRGLVQGKIICRVWPPEYIGLVDSKVKQYKPRTD